MKPASDISIILDSCSLINAVTGLQDTNRKQSEKTGLDMLRLAGLHGARLVLSEVVSFEAASIIRGALDIGRHFRQLGYQYPWRERNSRIKHFIRTGISEQWLTIVEPQDAKLLLVMDRLRSAVTAVNWKGFSPTPAILRGQLLLQARGELLSRRNGGEDASLDIVRAQNGRGTSIFVTDDRNALTRASHEACVPLQTWELLMAIHKSDIWRTSSISEDEVKEIARLATGGGTLEAMAATWAAASKIDGRRDTVVEQLRSSASAAPAAGSDSPALSDDLQSAPKRPGRKIAVERWKDFAVVTKQPAIK